MTRALLPVLAVVVGVAACARFEVASERDPAADFSRCVTYAWIPFEKLPPPDPGMEDHGNARWLLAAIGAEMGLKGYREDASFPDLRLSFRAGVTDRRGTTIWGFGFGTRDPGAGSRVEEGYHRDAVLVFDATEPKTGRRLWRSSARGLLYTGADRERHLLDMVQAALAEFPPAAR